MTQISRADAAAPERQRDKERTRQEILDVAIREFARNGYSGARVDEIAARTWSSATSPAPPDPRDLGRR